MTESVATFERHKNNRFSVSQTRNKALSKILDKTDLESTFLIETRIGFLRKKSSKPRENDHSLLPKLNTHSVVRPTS